MRLVMVGTGPFGVPTFRRLLESRHEVSGLVTAPTERDGRSVPPSPLREVAAACGLPIFTPPDINTPEARHVIRAWAADLLVVCDYGQILFAETLAAARLGGVNLHASLLPKYRGAAPIQWAIYHGEKTTGVSVIHMTPQVDAGPVIAQSEVDILPDETAVELESRLAEIGAWLMLRTIDNLEAGLLEALPQDPKAACRAPKLKKTDGLVDWHRPAEAICNQVRALVPWPKTYTYWRRPGKPPMRVILEKVQAAARTDPAAEPCKVLETGSHGILVAAGDGAVLIRALQPAGKRIMSAEDFLRGYRLQVGDCLGGSEPGA